MSAPQTRTVCQQTGEVVMATLPLRELEDLRAALAKALEDLEGSRAEVAHYADLNLVLGKALERAADTAKNAVAQEAALRDDLDELRRDSDELWERAVRVQELEDRNESLRGEVAALRGERDTANVAPAAVIR